MAFNTGKKITRRNWDAIPMPDLVIARVNVLGIYQPELLTFTDRHCLSSKNDDLEQEDDDLEVPGVDSILDDDVESPGVDGVEGPEDPAPQAIQEIAIDDLEVQEPDPAPIEVETVPDETVEQVAPAIEPAAHLRGPARSTRVKMKTPGCVPSMSGYDFYQSEPDAVVAMVMTQLSLKAGLKAWGDSAYTAVHSSCIGARNTFKPKDLRELSRS